MKAVTLQSAAVPTPFSAKRRKLPPRTLLLGLATFAALALLPADAQAACKGGFCVSGSDQGGMHVVTFTTTWNHYNHFNLMNPDGSQNELGANQRQFSFRNKASGTVETFALQACSGGGFLSGSKCTVWAYFTHTAP